MKISSIYDDIVRIWEKELASLPVTKDLPRLARKFKLFDGNNEKYLIHYEENEVETDSIASIVYHLLACLDYTLRFDRRVDGIEAFKRLVEKQNRQQQQQQKQQMHMPTASHLITWRSSSACDGGPRIGMA
eukprot:GEZU01012012.1.p1 GENE.GEZU01012012.1~~GEZU01012012.1.p1  ORF type:complete len:131 (+),score=41.59 GEZU01012012.1:344-736(+)